MAPRRASYSLNPSWGHFLAAAAFICALASGAFRYFLLDRVDPLHCLALLSGGRWLDDKYTNWQPDGCMLYNYQPKDAANCLASRQVVFIGDSVTRELYFQFVHSLDASLPSAPPEDGNKHTDYHFMTNHHIELAFLWDPFLNASATQAYVHPSPVSGGLNHKVSDRPALLVIGSGLWYLRYASSSGGLPAWEAIIENTLHSISQTQAQAADMVIILPIEDVVSPKLSPDRAATMHAFDIDAMNSDLAHRIRPPSSLDPFSFSSPRRADSQPVYFPSVFNSMLDPSQTEDGLHFSNAVVKMQATILMNLRCNDVLPKTFPLDKTCCRSYPWPKPLHFLLLLAIILLGPVRLLLARRYDPRTKDGPWIPEEHYPFIVVSVSVAAIYIADRTGFWLKEQKQFDPLSFAFLSIVSLCTGLLSVQRAESDLGILNRDQTDEWKGWMQIAILIYHYLGASKISGIYNPIRVLVASYLFMTGYGHTTFYVKKANFGFLRVAQILIRLNLFTLVLAYTMNTDYISYYFSPLVSWWYLIIYVTMLVGARYNERTIFLVIKILLSMALVTGFMRTEWLLQAVFTFLERTCGIHWSAREWSFRVNLDIWIVYAGMIAALMVMKAREHHLTEHPRWPLVVKAAIGASVLTLVWFFAFELSMNKFDYNLIHPLLSLLPVSAFVIVRNASAILRSAHSKAFAFIGRCSLETFIIQYHFWLAGDTKGILLVIPGTRWRPLNMVLTTVMFIYVSHCVAHATGELTKWICATNKPQPSLPVPATSSTRPEHPPSGDEGQEIIFEAPDTLELPVRKDSEGNVLPPEPDTPMREPRRWVDRLVETSSPSPVTNIAASWQPGLKTKIIGTFAVMWILNILWIYP